MALSQGKLVTLKKRAEFLRVRGGARWATPVCVVEAKPSADSSPDQPPRFGFTVTKKLGKANVRNRIRRRLKAAVAGLAGTSGKPGTDYVLIARAAAYELPFAELVKNLDQALQRVHHPRSSGRRQR